jgi:hypothetical protein
MLALKDLCIVIVIREITCMISLKCKIIFIITSCYISSIIYSNVGFLAGEVMLEVANAKATVTLNVKYVTGRNGG